MIRAVVPSRLESKSVDVGVPGNYKHLSCGHDRLAEMDPARDDFLAGIKLLSGFGVENIKDQVTDRRCAEFCGLRRGGRCGRGIGWL